MEPLVTLAVPIYNGEKTIERCLCGIRNQTYRNIEVLVVDDGSTDHTERVLAKFTDADSRNTAIAVARGEFLHFVDGDDWIVKDATECFVRAAQESGCDMVISDFYRVIGHMITHKGDIPVNGLISRREYAENMMHAPANYYGVLWNKFFRPDLIKENGLMCSTRLDWCEDFQFNLEYLKLVENVYALQKPVYYYVKTKGSLVDTKIDLSETIRTKRILIDDYKELYQMLDMYEKNRLRIKIFYLEFARDKRRREHPARLA